MLKIHPDDAALLDRQEWDPDGQPCGYGKHPPAPTTPYGGDWICRKDLAWRLYLDRCAATNAELEATADQTSAQ